MTSTVLEADLTWVDGVFRPGVQIEVDGAGAIVALGSDLPVTDRRAGEAILPGFVNAHSHAFQRGLRGRGEHFPQSGGSFWTWRQEMYDLVDRLGVVEFQSISTQAFQEMRRSGMTTVGEFHYFHHDGTDGGFAMDEAVIAAAEAAGIRMVLLHAYYVTGGIAAPLQGGQRRFDTYSQEQYWAQIDALQARLAGTRHTMGVVVHSIRAAPLEDLALVHAEARRREMVVHIHLEEQVKEIEECKAAFGRTPMRVLLDTIDVDHQTVCVHCTHTQPQEMAEFIDRGGRVCICPLTEANLGDGIPQLANVPNHRLSLGTDSNARIDMLEEARWLEYGQRLNRQSRGIIRDPDGFNATELLHAATIGGGDALGSGGGRIAEGVPADLCAVDLSHLSLAGATAATLAEMIVFGCDASVITGTCVAGEWAS